MKLFNERWRGPNRRRVAEPLDPDQNPEVFDDLYSIRTGEDANRVLQSYDKQTSADKKPPFWKKQRVQWVGAAALAGTIVAVITGVEAAGFSADRTSSDDAQAIAARMGSCVASLSMAKIELTAQDMENLIDLEHDAGEQGISIEYSCTDAKFIRTLEVYNEDLSYDSERKRFLMNGNPVLATANVLIPDQLH